MKYIKTYEVYDLDLWIHKEPEFDVDSMIFDWEEDDKLVPKNKMEQIIRDNAYEFYVFLKEWILSDLWLKNFENQIDIGTNKYRYLESFLKRNKKSDYFTSSINWINTPEGLTFWNNMDKSYKEYLKRLNK